MARIYADEQYPLPVVEFLRPLGHDDRATIFKFAIDFRKRLRLSAVG